MRLATPGQWPVRASPVVSPIACRVFLPYLATQGGGTGTDFPVELIPATLNPGACGITSPSAIWEHGKDIWEQPVQIT
jgi:hypothetical protein